MTDALKFLVGFLLFVAVTSVLLPVAYALLIDKISGGEPEPSVSGGSSSMDAAPAKKQSLNSEAPLADAQSGARPDDPETLQLLQQAAEALENAAALLDDDDDREWLRTYHATRRQCESVAAALRALGER
jgi:hypothetical protein